CTGRNDVADLPDGHGPERGESPVGEQTGNIESEHRRVVDVDEGGAAAELRTPAGLRVRRDVPQKRRPVEERHEPDAPKQRALQLQLSELYPIEERKPG